MMTGLNHSYFDVMTLRKQLQKKRYHLSLRPMKTRVAGGCFAKEVVLLYFRLLKKALRLTAASLANSLRIVNADEHHLVWQAPLVGARMRCAVAHEAEIDSRYAPHDDRISVVHGPDFRH